MNRQSKKHSAFYKYLEPFLEKGNEKEIALARKLYLSQYKARWRKEKRRKEKELTCSWTVEELKILSREAKLHKMSSSKFIKTSSLAYIDKRYIVPDQIEVRRIAQLLSITYNSIREMMDENALQLQTGKIILEKIFDLEREVLVSLHNPKTIEQWITEAVIKNQQTKTQLYHLLEILS